MPELPEVEVTRLGIAPAITGLRLQRVRLGKPLRWPLGCAPELLHGRVITGVRRRGKYLLLDLDQGAVLVLHLGMSGSVRILDKDNPPGPHDHVDLVFADRLLRLHDPRRFGALIYADSSDAPHVHKLLVKLGVEPLSEQFSPQTLKTGFQGRSVSVKQALLAGDVVVGVGNIYASEALFLAGIHPKTAAGRIGPARLAKLHAAVVQVLAQAVEKGGSSLRDFVAADGSHGHFQLSAQVYGRAGQPCRVCHAPIKHIVQGQRSTYYCAQCQH
ncbi:bifunctional DNA-formamidopyrimidine glycosylase/DNA-(apurinic or apyrimidinic site) lyase [Lampropedia aestuarii]|uniref:Formamidopyrimidine-DNA glycosylase n=1 Tax=Lampropedia aestuarii TaxID=2562762 RepID=A0A4S5BU32_9BURK|nr:bifunctional DNA-formamidopyrimidine glycosylase/DNA-(apurinic or apyrimidinic site) lyase [Lampropedia aestuarii]MDH5858764.1 bifunctional DNA-formamidopyrimidine glycosylase/DNA-(apurinic or apyrimidinic site) lyase [Lampropedia aestuarii]THJ34601.1 bifunctional DNA-formamidopyrimidine glycosylase/DNA-(apurinic or apyrimidinic site) lyase [Lampropedia aestuarii]